LGFDQFHLSSPQFIILQLQFNLMNLQFVHDPLHIFGGHVGDVVRRRAQQLLGPLSDRLRRFSLVGLVWIRHDWSLAKFAGPRGNPVMPVCRMRGVKEDLPDKVTSERRALQSLPKPARILAGSQIAASEHGA
jgi:hypothetical protein